ncbi:uncharacterized protein LOC117173253 [Belonocnema kinseyi]|uniref:uncharacterized protein LOC117173253 n=1 Tax=Belonocnema kinseyi TaxID=2817044 RepID=UPI00143DB666|nr:uncharacterized protein LOC117173253 [Belonocnema kinseyi]XP_033217614.1 uncharacterized protein LOC117173253 [Belonocnema kinseyi]
MNFACKCLNVTIKSRSKKLERVNVEDVTGLTPAEKHDAFFQESVATVPELEVIIKEQPALLQCKNIGSWLTHYCCNCQMFTHAVNAEDGITMVLINPNMVRSTEEMEAIKTSPNYSSVFRIVIDRKKLNDMDSFLPPVMIPLSQIPNNLQSNLLSLQQQLQEAIDRQTQFIDEKIQAFTMEQRQLLERFQEQAYMDHRLLSRMVCKKEEKLKPAVKPRRRTKSLKTSESSSVTNSVSIRQPTEANTSESSVKESIFMNQQTEPSINTNINGNIDKTDYVRTRRREPSSYDAEALFPLEGMDDNVYSDDCQLSSDLESDTDESVKNEGTHVPRSQKRCYPMLAKSLPVSVPDFRPFGRRTAHDDDDDKESIDPRDPHNIRASIKALAKSVHGDTVFGDLPRPRFSTQI